ncbi:metallo-beta-lactamase family protein [Desulfobotulus alkaliphilus]|uniref:Metallo-beta-lactamase family protein n=1 Tax=Desulfobotulus alkaliphilus TaxID=622671 RepID=A0A562R0G4_9BACT|nr:MBL fold metallo-hydrolase [Desulfobotulus alkaliphilus]TWI62064.1 metallo-beta-lactamase family protein [Desulfobotulus alkaliphilus]
MINIIHHGGKEGVTGSCHQLMLEKGKSLLIDCGLFQGAEVSPDNVTAKNPDPHTISFDTRNILALVITHSHIDHAGRIPWLLAAGFQGPVICSEPSAELLPLMLEDAFKLSVSARPDMLDRYTSLIRSRLRPLPYKTWHTLLDSSGQMLRIKLHRAGHILGSSIVECAILDKSTGKDQRIVFSGDLGAPWAPLLPAPKPLYRADTLILESTYGDRTHEDRKNRRNRLETLVVDCFKNGGTLLVPAFSLGRTQEILYELEDILHTRAEESLNKGWLWKDLPVYLDSPLAGRITDIYRSLKPFWDREAHQKLGRGRKPLAFDQLITLDSHAAHISNVRELTQSAKPAIVIAGSGMCTAGRIVNYLKTMLKDPRHTVLFVGYQAAGTPGRDIQRFGPRGGYVFLDGEKIFIRSRIESISGYSAHADQRDLVRFATRMRHRPGEIHLVHGEEGARKSLKEELEKAYAALGNVVKVVL